MSDDLFVVEKVRLGYTDSITRIDFDKTLDDDGTVVPQPRLTTSTYLIVADKYNREWPGTITDTLFAVEKYEHRHGGRTSGDGFFCTHAWGFMTEEEAFDFLNGKGLREYHSFDRSGKHVSDVRTRLEIPDAKIYRL